MELSAEETNYLKITKIVIETIPKYLRRCFIQRWNKKYHQKKWKSDNASGLFLFNQLPDKIKNNKSNEMSIDKIKTGNEQTWDTSTLVLVMLNSGLKLIKGVRPSHERSTPLRISEEIDIIRGIRNSHFAHASSMSCSSDDFTKIMTDIKSTARNIFDKDAEKEIDEIEKSQMEAKITTGLRRQLEIEIKHDQELDIAFEGNLKTKYKARYEKHEIHVIDSKGSISLQMRKIDDFYVKQKISPELPPEATFRAEAIRQSESFKGFKVDDIDIPQLIDRDTDVTFVCGSAGVGKTVLAKKLAYGWANGSTYAEFQWCIMFECRDINYFQATDGANLKSHELVGTFLEANFAFDFRDGNGMLFIIDGLDELHGITADDSMVRQLLELTYSKYIGSKIIVTGRPHIEETLLRSCRKMCSLRKVEIQGLCDEQVEEYVKKFNSCESDVVDISKAKDSSNRYLAIMHTPQHLNTLCCIAKFLKEESVCHTELYCWALYLFLRQHGDRRSSNEKQIPEIFGKYSNDLVILCSVSYKLLIKNKVILEDDIQSQLEGTGAGTEFIKSLFADVSDIYKKKYQFKHLSLIEFLSAIYICTCKTRMKIIEYLLENGHIEVVLFICQIVEGFRIGGNVRKSLLQAVNFKPTNSKNFCNDVVQALQRCTLDDWSKFGQSLDIIGCFLNFNVNNEKTITPSIRNLRCGDPYLSNTKYSKKLFEVIKHLKNVCKCNTDTILAVFDNINVTRIAVDEFEALNGVQYLRNTDGITLRDIASNVSTIQEEIKERIGERCKLVVLEHCQLDGMGDRDDRAFHSKYEVLQVEKCKLNMRSFVQLCKWGTCCKVFVISALVIEDDWWLKLVEIIEEAWANTDRALGLQKLCIKECSTMLNDEMVTRIIQCGVDIPTRKPSCSMSTSQAPPIHHATLSENNNNRASNSQFGQRSASTSSVPKSPQTLDFTLRQLSSSTSVLSNPKFSINLPSQQLYASTSSLVASKPSMTLPSQQLYASNSLLPNLQRSMTLPSQPLHASISPLTSPTHVRSSSSSSLNSPPQTALFLVAEDEED